MSVATTLVYLYIGLDDRRKQEDISWPNNIGGHIELVEWLEERAEWLEELYDKEFAQLNLTFVFDYDITEELGAWALDNLDHTREQFETKAREFVNETIST